MNKNFSNRLVFLTEAGANRLFDNPLCQFLKVVVEGPILHDSGQIIYLDAYEAVSGRRIGGCIDGDAFTDQEPPSEWIIEAEQAYEDHCKYMDNRFGTQERTSVNTAEILAKEQEEPVPLAYIDAYLKNRRKK